MLNDLAGANPAQAGELRAAAERLWDLLPVIQNHYYHPEFRGSFSIKAVLPSLVPEEGWSTLETADGMSAALMYEQALNTDDECARNRLFDALRAYCRQDTLAMVRVREALLETARR